MILTIDYYWLQATTIDLLLIAYDVLLMPASEKPFDDQIVIAVLSVLKHWAS